MKRPRGADVTTEIATELEPELGGEAGEAYYKLFPAEGSADEQWTPVNPGHVLEVRLYRIVAGKQDHLDNYPPSELEDERAVRKLHGGGQYLAIAVDARKGKIGRVLRRRVFTLSGEPMEPKAPPPAAAPAAAQTSSEELPAWVKGALAIASTILPPTLTYIQASSQQALQQQQQYQALLMEAMKGDRAAYAELVKALATPRDPPPAPAPAAAAGAASPVSTIKDIVGCMKELGFKREEPDMLESLMPLIAMRMLGGAGMGGPPPFGPGAPPATPAPILN